MPATHSLSLVSASSQYAISSDANNLSVSNTGKISIGLWVNPTTLNNNNYAIWKGTSSNYEYQIVAGDANGAINVAFFSLAGNVRYNIVTANNTIPINLWSNVFITLDDSVAHSINNLKIYVNGEPAVTGSSSSNSANLLGNGSAPLNVGRRQDTTVYFNGKISNIQVYNTALSQSNIQSVMNYFVTSHANIVACWTLNNVYTDLIGSNTLTASGSPTFSTTYPDAIDLVENKTFTKKHKITVQHTQVAGSADLTDVPIVLTESNFLADAFSSTYNGSEINSTRFLTDANIKAYYRMESGALTTDSSGNGYTLTNNNTVADGTGKYGGAADGGSSNTNKSLSTTNLMGFGVNDARTLSCWIKMNTEHSGADKYQYIFSSSHALEDRSYDIGYFRISSVNYIYIFHNRAGGVSDSTIKAINLGTSDWYHLALTFDGTTLKGFINGEKIGSVAVTKTNGPVNSFTDGLHILRGPDLGGNISALIDDAVIFNRALTEGEIAVITGKGRDLRFSTDIDGKTRLAHEIVSFDKGTSKAEVWVKANTLDFDDNTDIYVHYGNATASALDENEAFGKHQVWGENWEGVWHLESSSVDSSKNSNDGTDTSVSYGASYGKIKQGASFNGSTSFINAGTSASLRLQTLTFLAWVDHTPGAYQGIIGPSVSNGADFRIENTDKIQLLKSGAVGFGPSSGTLGTGFNHAGVTYNGSSFVYYINGSASGSGTNAQTFSYTGNFQLGSTDGGGAYKLNGYLDQVMVYSGVLSADYIATLYNNQNSPSTFAIPSSLAGGSFLFNFV